MTHGDFQIPNLLQVVVIEVRKQYNFFLFVDFHPSGLVVGLGGLRNEKAPVVSASENLRCGKWVWYQRDDQSQYDPLGKVFVAPQSRLKCSDSINRQLCHLDILLRRRSETQSTHLAATTVSFCGAFEKGERGQHRRPVGPKTGASVIFVYRNRFQIVFRAVDEHSNFWTRTGSPTVFFPSNWSFDKSTANAAGRPQIFLQRKTLSTDSHCEAWGV